MGNLCSVPSVKEPYSTGRHSVEPSAINQHRTKIYEHRAAPLQVTAGPLARSLAEPQTNASQQLKAANGYALQYSHAGEAINASNVMRPGMANMPTCSAPAQRPAPQPATSANSGTSTSTPPAQMLAAEPVVVMVQASQPANAEPTSAPTAAVNPADQHMTAAPAATVAEPETVQPESIPATFNWTRGKLIGAGAFGRVFQGLDNDTGHILAVKQVALTKDEALKGRVAEHIRALEAEVAVLRQLNHRNIVRYLGTERSDDTLNIFLEYVPGGSIASLIEKFGPLQESVVRKYTQQILLGLEYLHQKKIMHRDIKGANILVDPQGTVKLADFGASRRIEDLATVGSGSKSIRGTPYWMAPEVIKQTGHGRPADIWSLGCVVIEMATGKPPWSNCNTQVAAMFHIASTKEPPPLPENLSPEARDFLLLCFNRVPKDRPNATRLLRHPWLANIPAPGSSIASSSCLQMTASASTAGLQRVTAGLPPMAPHNQQRPGTNVPLHGTSPSPIKEEQPHDPTRSSAVHGTSNGMMSVSASHHRVIPAALHMPLAIGPLEQGRRQSLMAQTAASMALSSGLPIPANIAASVKSSMVVNTPAPTQTTVPAVDSTSSGAVAGASAPTAVQQPVAQESRIPRNPSSSRLTTGQSVDLAASASNISTAPQADPKPTTTNTVSVAPSSASAPNLDRPEAAAPLVQPQTDPTGVQAAQAEPVLAHSISETANLNDIDIRQSFMTLDYNPMLEPTWMPGLMQLPRFDSAQGDSQDTQSEHTSGGLPVIHEASDSGGVEVQVDMPLLRPQRDDACSGSKQGTPRGSRYQSTPVAVASPTRNRDQTSGSSAGRMPQNVFTNPAALDTYEDSDQPEAWCQTLDVRGSVWATNNPLLRSVSPTASTKKCATAAPANDLIPVNPGTGAAHRALLGGLDDVDPVRQSKVQRWRDDLSAELASERQKAAQQRAARKSQLPSNAGRCNSGSGSSSNGAVGDRHCTPSVQMIATAP